MKTFAIEVQAEVLLELQIEAETQEEAIGKYMGQDYSVIRDVLVEYGPDDVIGWTMKGIEVCQDDDEE